MTDNVIPIFGEFIHDEPVDEFLDKVKNNNLEECIIIGHDEDGKLYVGGNISEFEKIVFLLFRAECEMKRIEGNFPNCYDEATDNLD